MWTKVHPIIHSLRFMLVLALSTLACSFYADAAQAFTPVFTLVTSTARPSGIPATSTGAHQLPTVKPAGFSSAIEQENPQRYRVKFVVTVRNRGFAINRLLVYQARPIDWDGQQDVQIESVSPTPAKQGNDPVHGNGVYFWEIRNRPGIGDSLAFSFQFTYTAYEITAHINPDDIQPYQMNSGQYGLYTKSENFIEANDPHIMQLADQIAGEEKNPYLIARKVYEYVIRTARYELVGKGLLGAKALLGNGYGECGDYSALLIALLRAEGIPARPVVGYWAISGLEQTHVWAEFYLEDVGWVPVDPTIGQQSPSKEAYYFGGMDNQRVILHKGFNIAMDPPAPENFIAPLLQEPAWWYWGDSGDDSLVTIERTEWSVTAIS
jgi:transglutaminase-like putative cysteine protease